MLIDWIPVKTDGYHWDAVVVDLIPLLPDGDVGIWFGTSRCNEYYQKTPKELIVVFLQVDLTSRNSRTR